MVVVSNPWNAAAAAKAMDQRYVRLYWRQLLGQLPPEGIAKGDETYLADVYGRLGLGYSEALAFFKALDNARIGWFLVGRRGYRTRFIWAQAPSYVLSRIGEDPPAELNEVAGAEEDREVAQEDSESVADEGAADDQTSETEVEIQDYPFPLRDGLMLTISVPKDFTPSEAQRLARFVTSLPVGS